jgi:hypothetical protein
MKNLPRTSYRRENDVCRQEEDGKEWVFPYMGRLPPGNFASRYLPVGFQASRVGRWRGNGEKWWRLCENAKFYIARATTIQHRSVFDSIRSPFPNG